MIVVDANILLYAHNAADPRNEKAGAWLGRALSETELGLPTVVLVAFVRIGTDPRIFARPLDPMEALDIVGEWLERPNVTVVHPTSRHWAILKELVSAGRARGADITDAHIATLAVEHGAELSTSDRGFRRFPRLRIIDPTE